jgi:hypothetical protein
VKDATKVIRLQPSRLLLAKPELTHGRGRNDVTDSARDANPKEYFALVPSKAQTTRFDVVISFKFTPRFILDVVNERGYIPLPFLLFYKNNSNNFFFSSHNV